MYCWIEDPILDGVQAYKKVKCIAYLSELLQKDTDLNRNARIKKPHNKTAQNVLYQGNDLWPSEK